MHPLSVFLRDLSRVERTWPPVDARDAIETGTQDFRSGNLALADHTAHFIGGKITEFHALIPE